MKLKVFGDRVIVKADEAPKQVGAILITEEWKSLPPFGTVLAVGEDVSEVKVGDRVMFERYAAVVLEGQDRLVLERHIHAVITDEA